METCHDAKRGFYLAVSRDMPRTAAFCARECELVCLEEGKVREARQWAQQARYYEEGGEDNASCA